MNGKTELFLDKYKRLEALVSAQYDLRDSESAVHFLERRPEFQGIKGELAYCREVRNLLTHNPKIDNRYAVVPSDGMIALLDRVIARVTDPQRAKHIWVPRQTVMSRTMDDYVRPAMMEMNAQLYSHIPILRDGVVIGVFSENTLLRYLIDEETVSIDKNMKFSDIGHYLPLDRHRAESFRFIGQETLASEIEEIFAEATRKSDRIGLLFVTKNGRATEKLLGIISPWDAAGIA